MEKVPMPSPLLRMTTMHAIIGNQCMLAFILRVITISSIQVLICKKSCIILQLVVSNKTGQIVIIPSKYMVNLK